MGTNKVPTWWVALVSFLVGVEATYLVLYVLVFNSAPGTIWPGAVATPAPPRYERTVIFSGGQNIEARLQPLLTDGWEVERVEEVGGSSSGFKGFFMRRRSP